MKITPEPETSRSFLTGLAVLEPLQMEALQVFPLRRAIDHSPAYALIDELLEDGRAEVTEIDDVGHVPEVLVRNRAPLDALILDGTELRGAKQNRMVNISIIAGAHTETRIPVSCVEQGRWFHRSTRFASAKRTVGSRLRREKALMVAESLQRSKRAATDQGRVWRGVSEYLRAADVSSATEALDDAFLSHEQRIDALCQSAALIDVHGALVAHDGEVVGMDLFDATATFTKTWPTLLRGHTLDVLLQPVREDRILTRDEAVAWITNAAAAVTLTPHEVPGIGLYLAVAAAGLAGGIVTRQGSPVHAAIFSAPPRDFGH